MTKFNSLIVKEIIKVTPNAYSVKFEIPPEFISFYQFQPGQHVTIKCNIKGKEIRRCYSISSNKDQEYLQIVVKKIPNGVFSDYITTRLKVGDFIDVSLPEGNFIYDGTQSFDCNYIAIAVGSGITPIFSIIKEILHKSNNNMMLFYGNQNVEHTIFFQYLKELAFQFPDRFDLRLFFSQENQPNSTFGRLNPTELLQTIENKINLEIIDKFLVCGPEKLIKDTINSLRSAGISDKKISYELFYSDQKAEVTGHLVEEYTSIKIVLNGEENEIIVKRNQSLLDSILESGLDAPYSCLNGLCSTCSCQLIKGKVKIIKNNVLSEADLENGKIISCQSFPVTDFIEVNFDLV